MITAENKERAAAARNEESLGGRGFTVADTIP
jgi:hypothetical protein